jgi:hypothetical protein
MAQPLSLPKEIQIAIVAPFPSDGLVQEGWMSRIATMDAVLKDFKRIYLNFADHHVAGHDDWLRQHSVDVWEVCINSTSQEHRLFMEALINQVRSIYVHTCHLAEHIESWLPTGKFFVDMHGIVPEEEEMLGRPELIPKYTRIEQAVLDHCKGIIVVTKAMERHFMEKYPSITNKFLVLPILESYPERRTRVAPEHELPVRAVYAGGRQVWQNIDATLQLAFDTKEFAQFNFYSHEYKFMQKRASELSLDVDSHFSFVSKSALPEKYLANDFGMVLRDDTAVNRVSCPTKLSEYLDFGLIPVVRTPCLGDFQELGYSYVNEPDFREGFIPDQTSRKWMRENNYSVLQQIQKKFYESVPVILDWMKGTK